VDHPLADPPGISRNEINPIKQKGGFEMSRQNVNPCSWRFGLIAVLAIVLTLGFSGTPSALADPSSPLSVTKTASPSPVASGAEITYTITVVNTGGAKVSNVVMTDQLNGVGGIGVPPQLVLTSTRGSCSQSGLKVTCSAGSIEGLGSWIVTIRGVVTAANGTTLNNTASVTGTKSAQNFTTTASVQTLVQNNNPSPLADLTISKSGPSSVVQLSPMTYILTVNNIGNANATDIRVVDTLPAGVMADYVDSTSLFVCASGGSPVTITCDGGAVNQGSNATITIHAIAPSTTGNIANTAVVDPNNTIVESNELNNTSATVSTSVTSAPASQGLTITKTDDPDPVVPGAILKYTIVVQNIATTRADDVVVVDGTQGLEAASITASQVIVNGSVGNTGGCKVVAPQVTCSIKSLNSGGTQTITIQGQVIGSAGSSIINTATVTGNIKNQGVTAQATAHTTVKPAVDLTITKADSPDPVCARSWPQPADRLTNPPDGLTAADGTVPTLLATPGCLGGLTYTFVVGNSGIQDATAVVVRDPLPGGLILDSYSTDGGFTCAVDAANVVTCSGGAIPAESTRTISFLLVAPPDTGSISNTVTVDPNNAIYESDETNNTFVQATAVTTGIDLVIRKDDSPVDPPGAQNVTEGFDPIATSGTETYVITVDNVGPQDVTGIRVRDTLPAATRFLSVVADADHGFTCAHDGSPTGGIVECVGGHLLGTESEFYDPAGPALAGPGDDIATIKIKVFAQPTVGTMHNEVRVDPLNEIVEYNELNNFETEDTTVTNGGATLSAFNELSVVKTQTSPVPPDAVATNGTLKYKLDITNDATDPAVNIHVRDFLPTGARFIEAVDAVPGPDAFNCTYAAGVIDCVGGTLDGTLDLLGAGIGQTRTINITVFAPNTPGDYSNQSIVDPDNAIPEGNEFNNDSTIVTKVRTVGDGGKNAFNELTIKKTQTAPPSNIVATSSLVVYEIVVENTGTDPAFNVAVKDTLPAGFTYVEATDTAPGSQAFVCTTAPGNVVNCTGATLSGTVNTASGQPTSRTIQVKAFSSAVPGNYTNTAIVDPDNAIPEGDETNNMAQAPTKVLVGAGFIDLQIAKTGPAKVVPGAMIEYALTVSNAGTDPAFNVKVRDDLPAGTTFVSAADTTGGAGAFACSQAGSSVTCTGGTLDGTDNLIPGPPDVPTSRTIQVKVLAPSNIEALAPDKSNISVSIINQAFVDPDNAIAESNETNNAASATTTVRSQINLRVTKDGPTTASQNDTADYVIKVYNEDNDGGDGVTAFGVELVDPLPVGLIPLYVKTEPTDASNFRCEIQENPVNRVYCIGDLGPQTPPSGQPDTHIATVTVHVFVTADGGPLDNEACVDPNHLISEQNETDNCVHKITSVVPPAPDLLINKTADSSVVTPGQNLTYKITVSNVGNADTTSAVNVTDNLPSQVTLVNATATNGFTCSGTTTISCTGSSLSAGQSTEIDILTTVNDGVTTSFANTASVSVDPAETNTANNGPVTVTTSAGGSGIDLQVSSITDTPDPANVNQALTYTIIVVNNGTSTAGTVADPAQVRVDLPQNGVSFVGADGSNGFNCSLSSSTLTCEGVFPGGGSTIITVHLTVVNGAPPDLTVVAIADPTNKFVESNEGNNTKTEVTTVSNSVCTVTPCIDLVMAQVLGSPNPVQVGSTETFKVEVVNVGDTNTAPGSHVSVDVISLGNFSGPAISAPAGFSCSTVVSGTGVVWYNCTGDLGPGVGVSFTLTMTATGPTPGTISTFGSVTLTAGALVPEFTTSNNSASYSTNVIP
jgi:uncharacterized repeat protein (TIGR01451 family)